MPLPANVNFCEVTGRFLRAVADGADPGKEPDGVPIPGLKVQFLASLNPPVVRNLANEVSIVIDPIVCTTDDNGVLLGPDGTPGVLLVASDDVDLDPHGWTWKVTVSGPSFSAITFSFVAPVDGKVDLSTVVPVPPNPGSQVSQWQAAVTATETARGEAVEAAGEAVAAKGDAVAAAERAEAVPVTNDAIMAPILADPESQSGAQLRDAIGEAIAETGGGGGGAFVDSTSLRTAIRSQQITEARPLVAIGDSHTDAATSATNLWDRLRTLHTQPGQGLEGLDPAAIVVRGQNGQTLANYLANLDSVNGWNSVVALNPSWIVPCWLTNDVRLGGLGLGVAAVRANAKALLLRLIDLARKDVPTARIVLRIPAPYTQQNSASQNYITDGTNVNPAGLAQIYTDGVRLGHYDAAADRPGVLVYDPQTRFFGTTSPTVNGGANSGYYGDQIHQNVNGYRAEADDFAAWVSAQEPFNTAASTEARIVQNPAAPWLAYHRAPEDADRYVKVADAAVARANTGETFLDLGPSFPGAIPNSIKRFDIVVLYGAESAWEITTTSSIAASGANTRISGIPAIPKGAAVGTRVAIFRRITTPDDALNVILRDRSFRYKRTGVVQNGSTTYLDLNAKAFGADPVLDASTWATELAAGDKVYVEGRTATPLTIGTDTSSNAASGASVRLQGSLQGIDWSAHVGKAVVIVSNGHA